MGSKIKLPRKRKKEYLKSNSAVDYKLNILVIEVSIEDNWKNCSNKFIKKLNRQDSKVQYY